MKERLRKVGVNRESAVEKCPFYLGQRKSVSTRRYIDYEIYFGRVNCIGM